jgi:predicted permease
MVYLATLLLRRFRQSPRFFLLSILPLAIAIAITSSSYSVVQSLLNPIPGTKGLERLVRLEQRTPNKLSRSRSDDILQEIEPFVGPTKIFDSVARFRGQTAAIQIADSVSVERVEYVTDSYFELLGVRADEGRLIRSGEATQDQQSGAVVISTRLRDRVYDLGALPPGATLKVFGHELPIVGVTDNDFRGLDQPVSHPTSVWIAWPMTTDIAGTEKPFRLIARLSPDHTIDAATAALSTLNREMHSARWAVRPLLDSSRSSLNWAGGLLFLCVATVFLVACSNAANLFISRGLARAGEVTIRHQLGASPWRLILEESAEPILVSAGATALSVVLARAFLWQGLSLMNNRFPAGTVPVIEPHLSLSAFLLPFVLTVAVLVTTTTISVVRRTRAKAAGRWSLGTAVTGTWRHRRRLIACQVVFSGLLYQLAVAAAMVSTTGPGTLRPSFSDALAVDLWLGARPDNAKSAASDVANIVDGVRGIPGVLGAAAFSATPMGAVGRESAIYPLDSAGTASKRVVHVELIGVLGQAFDVLSARDVSGRELPRHLGLSDVVASERLATRAFGSVTSVGRHLQIGDTVYTVVGVIPDVPTIPGGMRTAVAYLPLDRVETETVQVIALTHGSTSVPSERIRSTIRHVAAHVPITRIADGSSLNVGPQVVLDLVGIAALGLATLALVLAATGLYGLMNEAVVAQLREFGIRAAVGATPRHLMVLVCRQGLVPMVLGLTCALASAIAVRTILRWSVSTQVPVVDALSMGVTAAILMFSAVVACFWPTLRASRVSPQVVLRSN